jgi:hypothetical protein
MIAKRELVRRVVILLLEAIVPPVIAHRVVTLHPVAIAHRAIGPRVASTTAINEVDLREADHPEATVLLVATVLRAQTDLRRSNHAVDRNAVPVVGLTVAPIVVPLAGVRPSGRFANAHSSGVSTRQRFRRYTRS